MPNPTISAQDVRRELADRIVEALAHYEKDLQTASLWNPKGLPDTRVEISAADARDVIAALRAEPARGAEDKPLPSIEFHQQDWIPGFAAFLPGATTPSPDSKAFCVLNLGSMLSTVYHGDTARDDLPYFLADSIMHEVIHVLEQWAGVEFSEDRVDALIAKYRALPQAKGGEE